jgi:nucleoside-diphosphate-sugar epimerase
VHALIGSTGFVGRNLAMQSRFDVAVSSVGVKLLEHQHVERLVCAGAPAAKWQANADPEADWAAISRLIASLKTIRTEQLILISTIDVYPSLVDADERFGFEQGAAHAYGRHRFALEQAVRAQHPDALIVRLPALYGHALKKNALFDLLHHHQLDRLNGASRFQWYGLDRLAGDLERALQLQLKTLNLFTEPVALDEIAALFVPAISLPSDPASAVSYQLRSVHAEAFGGANGWIENRATVLQRLRRFIAAH